MSQNKVVVKHLTVNYDRKAAVWDISFEVPKGSLVGVIGPNGAGKSSLIKAMLGLLPPLSGETIFFGKRLHEMKGKLAYIGQRSRIDWDFPITVLEVVLMGVYGSLGIGRWPSKLDRERATEVLKKIGMLEFKDRQISDLSGGQQQRIFIGRALMQEAEIYFFDEPFVGIDKATEMLIVSLFKELTDQGKTIFVVHHDLNTVSKYFDFVIMLNLRLIASGPLAISYTQENLKKAFSDTGSFLEEVVALSEKRQDGVL